MPKHLSEDRLDPNNCNKAKCKSCMFGDTPIKLSSDRMDEITAYLVKGESSHICHTTNKTCYGALELQAKVFFAHGLLKEPTVECLLATAAEVLGKAQ
jgi:hypothetical protein